MKCWSSLPVLVLVTILSLTESVDVASNTTTPATINATTSAAPFFPSVQPRATYTLEELVKNSFAYLGGAALLLLLYALVNWSPKAARWWMPRWFNSSLITELVTGSASPSRQQVVDVIVQSDPSVGEVAPVEQSEEDEAMRRAPECRNGLRSCCRRLCCGCKRKCRCGYFNWLWTPFVTSELEFVQRSGIDGYLLFRTMRLLLVFAGSTLVVTTCILLPTYYSQSIPCEAPTGSLFVNVTACNVTTDPLTNVTCSCGFLARVALAAGDHLLIQQIAAVAVQAALSAAFLFFLGKEFHYLMQVRRSYFETAPPEIYTVMVRFIPAYLRSEVRLHRFFEDLYPGMVHSVDFCPVEKTKLGAFGLVPKLEHVQTQIAREEGIKNASINSKAASCIRCRDPTHSIEKLHAKEQKVLHAISKARASYVDAVARVANAEPPPQHEYHLPGIADVFDATGGAPWVGQHHAAKLEELEEDLETHSQQVDGRSYSDAGLQGSGSEDDEDDDDDDYGNSSSSNSLVDNLPSKKGGSGMIGTTDEPSEAAAADPLELYSFNAFVTFKSAVVALSCARDSVVAAASQMKLVPAREPRDVRWEKISSHIPNGSGPINCFIGAMYITIFIFWGTVVFVVGAYTSPKSLACIVNPNCTDALNGHGDEGLSSLEQSLIAIVSPLFLQILSALVKPIISVLVRLKFTAFNSEVDREIFVLFWVFQVLQNFLFYSVSSTLFSKLFVYLQEPLQLLSDVGTTIPEGASFYIIFIEIEILFTLVFGMWRVTWMSNFLLRLGLCGCKWPMSKKEETTILCGSCGTPSMPQAGEIGSPLIRVLFIFLLVNAYAVLQPLISVVGLLYAITSLLIYTHQSLSFATRNYDSAGMYWRDIYKIIIACIIIPQVVLLSMLLLSTNVYLSSAQGLVIIVTATASFFIYQPHKRDVKAYPLHLASKLDASRASAANSSELQRAEYFQSAAAAATASASRSESVSGVSGTPAATKPHLIVVSENSSSLSQPLLPGGEATRAATYGEEEEEEGKITSDGTQTTNKMAVGIADGDANNDRVTAAELQQIRGRLNASLVVIPPHIWRSPSRPISALVSRSYLVPATGIDIVHANRHVVEEVRASGIVADHARMQLLASTFVYDYTHPALRTARNVTENVETGAMRSFSRTASMSSSASFLRGAPATSCAIDLVEEGTDASARNDARVHEEARIN